MNKKITSLLFIVTLICLIATVSATENITATDTGEVNDEFNIQTLQKTSYTDQKSEIINNHITNVVNNNSKTIQTTKNVKNTDNKKIQVNKNTTTKTTKNTGDSQVIIDKFNISSNSGSVLSLENNKIDITLNTTQNNKFDVTLLIDEYTSTQTINSINETMVVSYNYTPTTAGVKNVKVNIDYLNGTKTTIYNSTLNVYYNGYMGNSFVNKTNMTIREYEGKNTATLYTISEYKSGWKNIVSNFNASENGIIDANKIVDVLYYQGYNWNKNLNFSLSVNNKSLNPIASYADSKGFGTYNYPSGIVVYNITSAFNTDNNVINLTGIGNNSNVLYPGYLIVIYANNTQYTKIYLAEGADILNPTSSGYGATTDKTISYTKIENIKINGLNNTVLNTITAAADDINGSKILVNNQSYGSLTTTTDNHELSITTININNLVDGVNTIEEQAVNDNIFVMGSILTLTYDDIVKVNITSNSKTALALENNTINVTLNPIIIDNDKSNVTLCIDNFSSTQIVDPSNDSIILTYNYIPSTAGMKNISIIVDGKTIYNSTLNVFYNGYMGNSFVNKTNMTIREYEGKNTATLYIISEYKSGWKNIISNFNASENGITDANKIVDVLYYQGYNWNKNLNFSLSVNNKSLNPIVSYADSKGFGTYNYPSGIVVYNITSAFNTANNVINLTGIGNNSNVLYPGYLIVIYANNTRNTKIYLAEGADMLNPTSSGYGATTDKTISYTKIENINMKGLNNTVLNTITAAADDINGSNIIVNNQSYGSLTTTTNNHELSITTININNLVDGVNTIEEQAVNDNIFVMGSILTLTYNDSLKDTIIKVANITTNNNKTITLTANITDTNGNKVTGGNAIFKLNDKTLSQKINVVDGKIAYIYNIPADMTAKNYTITVVYSGNNIQKSAKADGKLTIIPNTINSNITVNSYKSLVDAVNSLKKPNTNKNTVATIYLTKGNYNVTQPIVWGNSTFKTLRIYGNNILLDGNAKQFITVENGYTLELYNFKIRYATATRGAVVYNKGTLNVYDSIFLNSTTTSNGGVIYNDHGKIKVLNSSFSNNVALNGAVIYNNNGFVNLTKDYFSYNTANRGGVNYNLGETLIVKSTFKNNNAKVNGGVSFNDKNTITITDSSFMNNKALNYGGVNYNNKNAKINITSSQHNNNTAVNGGVNANYGSMIIKSSNLNNNNASRGGVNYNYGNLQILKSTFKNNTVTTNAAVNYNDKGIISINDSTFQQNKATRDGGVNYNNRGDIIITHTKHINNAAARGTINYNIQTTITITNSTFTYTKANSNINFNDKGVYNIKDCKNIIL